MHSARGSAGCARVLVAKLVLHVPFLIVSGQGSAISSAIHSA